MLNFKAATVPKTNIIPETSIVEMFKCAESLRLLSQNGTRRHDNVHVSFAFDRNGRLAFVCHLNAIESGTDGHVNA